LHTTAEDGELIRRIRAGERDAFSALAARHGGSLLRFARILARDEATAREMVQEVWLGLLHAVDGLDERAGIKTWLLRSLANRAKALSASGGGRGGAPSAAAALGGDDPAVEPERFDARGMWADPPEGWTLETPRELAFQRDTRLAMEAAVDELPLAQKAVLVLRDLEGLEVEEIRDLLEIAVSDQRPLLHRARARVRRAIEAHERRAPGAGAVGHPSTLLGVVTRCGD
jgi:RNA polymerase sigma-70 factor (ECF subfamily)